MLNVVKQPCTAIISGATNCGKTELILNLLEREYFQHFENIVIICSTLKWNKTYRNRKWIWSDDNIFLITPKDNLYIILKEFSKLLQNMETLFILDDIISDNDLDKKRTPLLELAISGRHRDHSLWILTQSYTAIPKNLRRQSKMLFIFFPNHRSDLTILDQETNLIDDWSVIKHKLSKSKYKFLYIRLEFPREYQING